MHQECYCRVVDVICKHDGLQVCLDLTALQLLWALRSLLAAHKRLEPHCRHSEAIHLWFQSLVLSLVSGFVNRLAHLGSDEVADHCANLTDIVVSASDSLELDSRSVMELSYVQLSEGLNVNS